MPRIHCSGSFHEITSVVSKIALSESHTLSVTFGPFPQETAATRPSRNSSSFIMRQTARTKTPRSLILCGGLSEPGPLPDANRDARTWTCEMWEHPIGRFHWYSERSVTGVHGGKKIRKGSFLLEKKL